MSYNVRKAIMFWITLILGIIILSTQVYKYCTNKLELSYEEGIVTIVAVALMINPNILSNGLKWFFKSKYNAKNEQ